jgi:hypothetical protein
MYREFELKEIIDSYDDETINEMINDDNVKGFMIEFAETICGNVAILDNGVVKAMNDICNQDKFHIVMIYKYFDREFIKI